MIIVKPSGTFKALDEKVFLRDILNAAERLRRQAQQDAERTVATWEHKVYFKSWVLYRNGKIEIHLETRDPVWHYLDQGTKPHRIRPRRKKRLAFKTGGSPKTEPHVVASFPGQAGTHLVFAKEVRHPGIQARHWSDDIVKSLRPEFIKEVNNALARFARSIGEGK